MDQRFVAGGREGREHHIGVSVFSQLAGYEDVNDAERLCRDPAMRWVVGGRAPMGQAASASQMGRFGDLVADPAGQPRCSF